MPDRLARINESIRKVVSEMIGDLDDPRIGFVTVTRVEVARDFRHARVYFSVLDDSEQARRGAEAGLQAAHGVMQREVARQVKLRNTPQLHFVYDESTDRAMRITALLQDTAGESPKAQEET